MSEIALLISPEAKSAYFHDAEQVVEQEFHWVFNELPARLERRGPFTFLITEAGPDVFGDLMRLSFCQGLFLCEGDRLTPVDVEADWHLHDDFVFGSKFKGKTNERLTQLLMNLGLAALPGQARAQAKILDPMAGRGTTLLWAMRYGLNAWGIEPDKKAQPDVRQMLKKWSKIHRQKHRLTEGVLAKQGGKKGQPFIEFSVDDLRLRLAEGDTRHADVLYPKEKFDVLISDIPYGIQHMTQDGTRNPLELIEQALPAWRAVMKKHSVLVLAFNSNLPRREALTDLLQARNFEVMPFHAPHRMSESIVRDVVIAQPR